MSTAIFEYMEWVNVSLNGWELKPDAPKEVIKAYEEYKKLFIYFELDKEE